MNKPTLADGLTRREMMRLAMVGTVAVAAPISTGRAANPQPVSQKLPFSPEPLDPKVVESLANIPHSVLLYDLDGVERNLQNFRESDPEASVFYAVKCAPNPRVLSRLARAGSGFDVASRGEIDLALQAGAAPEKCIFSNTVKFPDDVAYAHSCGIKAFLADSPEQVRMQAEKAPGSLLYVRLLVDNPDAAHPLGEKFGTTPEKAMELLRLGKSLGLKPYGTHFHVGTQCFSARAWETPALQAAGIFKTIAEEGIELSFFDIGGGFPVQYLDRKVPTNREILSLVRETINRELPGRKLTLAIEPGRGLVGSAALISSRVMLRCERPDGEWLHLDVGVYQGFSDAPDGIRYAINVPGRTETPAPFILCGPTCDSVDMLSRNQYLPGDITTGDLVIFNKAGAYAECLFSRFNGIQSPEVQYLDDLV